MDLANYIYTLSDDESQLETDLAAAGVGSGSTVDGTTIQLE